MILRIPPKTVDHWVKLLRRAGSRETGGVLFGEHVGEADFRIVEATAQRLGGGPVAFKRNGGKAQRDLKSLSRRYGDDPSRFNYLGEWHSHPHVPATPSPIDEVTMHKLLSDPNCDVNFLVLLITRLSNAGTLELSASTYLATGQKLDCDVIFETTEATT
jgi:proteasome lid subunit RPN8/RPN11